MTKEEQKELTPEDLLYLNVIIRRLELVASIFGEHSVDMKFGFGKPCIEGNQISLPLDIMFLNWKNKKAFDEFEPIVIHEVFHLLWSNTVDLYKLPKKYRKWRDYCLELTKNLWFPSLVNVLEDLRVEAKGFKIYPGTKKYILKFLLKNVKNHTLALKRELKKKGLKEYTDDLLLLLNCYFTQMGTFIPGTSQRVQKTLLKYKPEIYDIITKSTFFGDSIDKGYELFKKLLKEGYFKLSPKQEKQKDGQMGTGKDDGTGDSSMMQALKEFLEDLLNQLAPLILKQQLMQNPPNFVKDDTANQNQLNTARKIFKRTEIDKSGTSHGSSDIYDVLETPVKITETNYSKYDNQFNVDFSKLKAHLLNLLEKTMREKYENGYRTGRKLDRSILPKWTLGLLNHNRIFQHKEIPDRYHSAFLLLIDLSSSINRQDLEHEISAMYLMSRLLSDLKIPFALYGYNNSMQDEAANIPQNFMGQNNRIFIIKEFNEEFTPIIKQRLVSLDSTGSTPTGPSFFYTTKKLEARYEHDKFFVLITDGDNDDGEPIRKKIHKYIQQHPEIKYMGIGVRFHNEKFMSEMFDNYVLIPKFDEIGRELVKLIKQAYNLK